MSNTIGRAKILTAPCIFFKKRYAAPVREDFRGGFRGGFSGQGGGKEGRGRRDGTGRAAGQDRAGQGGRERDKADESGRDRAAAGPTEAGRAWKRVRKRGGEENEENGGDAKKRKDWKKLEKTGKNWKMLEKTGKSDRGLPGRRSGGTGRERHSAVKPRRYRSLKPSSSTSTGQYSRSSSRRKRTV